MKVKDFPNWKRLIFEDRAILKSDLRYMAKSQVQALENLPVLLNTDKNLKRALDKRSFLWYNRQVN